MPTNVKISNSYYPIHTSNEERTIDAKTLATISKFNRLPNNVKDIISSNELMSSLTKVASSTKEKTFNIKDILQLFPDLTVAMQIIESSILSPNDMIGAAVNYNLKTIKLPSDIITSTLNMIKDRIEKEYGLLVKLPTILRDALFLKGAYAELIIPEVSVDDVIYNRNTTFSAVTSIDTIGNKISYEDNLDIDTLKSKYGSLNLITEITTDKIKISTEDINSYTFKNFTDGKPLKIDVSITDLGIAGIVDNIYSIKTPEIIQSEISNKVFNRLYRKRLSTESETVDNIFRVLKYGGVKEIVNIPTKDNASRKSIGKPVIMQLPVEYVIPVHVTSNVSKHLGYFILLDPDTGLPIDVKLTDSTYNSTVINSINNTNDSKLGLINKARSALIGIIKDDAKIEKLETLYSELVENMIENAFKNSAYDGIAKIEKDTDIYRVMLFRALKGQQTKLLFVPKELVAYYAFEYRDNGTGKSRLEKLAMLFTIRAVLTFTKVMASIKNSITNTIVRATLDDNDPNQMQTRDIIISEALKSRQVQLPFGLTKIEDLVSWAHSAGFIFDIKGKNIPNMEISVSDQGGSKVVPDMAIDEDIQEMIYMGLGITIDMVKSGYNADFATTIVARNLLFSKRISTDQQLFEPMLTDHVQKILYNDEEFIKQLTDLYKNNIDNILKYINNGNHSNSEVIKLIEEFNSDNKNKDILAEKLAISVIRDITISLPRPEQSEAQTMKAAFDAYKSTLDEYIDMIFSSTALPASVIGDLSNKLEDIKNGYKSILIKEWMTKNRYLPELAEAITVDDEGNPVFKGYDEYMVFAENFVKAITPYLKRTTDLAKIATDEVNKYNGNDNSGFTIDNENNDTYNYNDTNNSEYDENINEDIENTKNKKNKNVEDEDLDNNLNIPKEFR